MQSASRVWGARQFWLGVGLVSLLLACGALAQTISGSIAGTVLDAQGKAIPAASVTAVNQRGETFTAVSDAEGRFVFAQLQPGQYNITVTSPNFKTLEHKGITLNGNDKLSAGEFRLEVGAVTQSVEVQAEGVALKTESAERSDSLVGKQLQNIAVNGRSYLALAQLVPGVYSTNNYQTAGHGGLGGISANGARGNQNNLTLDGIGDVDTGNNGDQLATVSLDAVQEFKILTSNYQAEYGRSSGAQISVVTKSGTQAFHGEAFEYHRHEQFNANNWKNNRDGIPRQRYRFNDPGYNLGGPIYIPGHFNTHKDKLFFFFSQEFQRQLRPQGTRNVKMPTALERTGDFSQSVDNNGNPYPYVRDYTTGLPCKAGSTAGCFQDGGVLGKIPASRLYAPGLAILNIYPLPNALAAGNKGFNFRTGISDAYPRREDLLRIDYNLSSKWKIFGRYINNNDAVTSAYGSFVLGTNFPLVPITDARPGRALALNATTIISPTMTNEASYGFGHNQINIDPTTSGLTRAKLGLSALPLFYPSAVQKDFIPSFSFGGRIGSNPGLGTANAPFFNYNTTIDIIDNLSKVSGQHLFKMGVYIQRSRKDQTSFAAANGSYNFGDSGSNPFDSTYGYANAALGIFSSFNQASKYATGMYRYTNAETYVQDTWKIRPRLTLDYGLRLYWIQPQFDASLQTSTFLPASYSAGQAPRLYLPGCNDPACKKKYAYDPNSPNQQLPATAIGSLVPNSGNLLNGIFQAGHGISKYLMENRGIHVGPRFGFAYDLTGRQNIVLHAGAGTFFDRYQGNITFDELTNPPTTFSPTAVNGLVSGIDPTNALLAPSGIRAFAFDGHVPTVYNYSLGVQTKLPSNTVLDVSYVGSQSRHLLQNLNLNAIPYGATFLSQNQDPTKVAANPKAPLGSNAYDANFIRPYHGYGDIILHEYGGTSNYNSLQVSVNRRFVKGLFLGTAYTWSKALTTVSGDGDFFRIDGLTRAANYGRASFDVRHNLVFNYIYDAGDVTQYLGGFNNFVSRAVLNNWQISGIARFITGTPFGVGFGVNGIGNQNITGSYTEPARIVLNGNPLQGTTDSPYNRLNAAAFSLPAVGSIGLGAPVNYLSNPGINNFDLSLEKRFPVTERTAFTIRADAFNAFNHVQFTGINNGLSYSSLTSTTPNNLVYKADGTLNNINGFGSVNGARDPRIMQFAVRFEF
mgnify:CR=1 FL=1